MAWRTLTAATPLVVHEGRLLMIRERRTSGLRWSVPGGYADDGESLEEAAAREGEEETARPQTEEDIETVEFLVPTALEPGEIHPQTRAVLERWWPLRGQCPVFHLVADIVTPAGSNTPEYVFRG